MADKVLELLQPHLGRVRVPRNDEAIYKDECVYTFDTPESEHGLYVSLSSFYGFAKEYVQAYAAKSGNCVFLHIRRNKILKEDPEEPAEKEAAAGAPQRKITRLAIGVEGGYNEDATKKYEYTNQYHIVVAPHLEHQLPYPHDALPAQVRDAVEAVLAQDSAIVKLQKITVSGKWDGEVRVNSKYADSLHQHDNGVKIPPSGWKCEKCDLTHNLWLNLTDGSILCGRRFFDGSGGNDHAVQYYKETGYPLAVKLGTITADGGGDVYSYPEDDMVLDPKLNEHLAHFGINVAGMQKSEKTMVELELEINERIGEWSLLTESDSELTPLAGPGLTGLRNLGNSCYINSVMQVLFIIPDFIERFVKQAPKLFAEFPADPANNFDIQMAKLGTGMWSGKYSVLSENSLDSEHSTGVAPIMFKNAVCKDHPDFKTKTQQDALDFYIFLGTTLDRHSRNAALNPMESLRITFEDRYQCMTSQKVQYKQRVENCLTLQIPLDRASNLAEVKEYLEKLAKAPKTEKLELVRHKLHFQDLLDRFFETEKIDDYTSPAIKAKTKAEKRTRIVNMPDFLVLHLAKFKLDTDWSAKKMDVAVEMPDEIDLDQYRAKGLQPGEDPMPVDAEDGKPAFVIDATLLGSLMEMGFPEAACKRAIYFTKGAGLEPASQWLMTHIDDADFAAEFEIPNESSKDNFNINQEDVLQLVSMGFDEKQAKLALKETNGDITRATDWIFSHPNGVEGTDDAPKLRDGPGKYRLVAFISHMGASANAGHYVCHIRKDDQWVIFNDSKVAISQNPPKDLGYVYLFQRIA